MKAYDANEGHTWDKVSTFKGVTSSPILEEHTGADWLLSPVEYGVRTVGQLQRHRDDGAMFVQVKRGADSLSNPDGLYQSIARMYRFGIPVKQRALVFVGVYYEGPMGELMLNGDVVWKNIPALKNYTYRAWLSLQRHWLHLGGGAVYVVKESSYDQWMDDTVVDLIDYAVHPQRYVFPEQRIGSWEIIQEASSSLQLPVEAPPAMKLMASWPGMGKTLAERAYVYYVTNQGYTLLDVLYELTSVAKGAKYMPGWGRTKAENLAAACNMRAGKLVVEVKEQEF